MLSDAAHSALDLAGAALTFFSVRVSDKPADEDHTYGHGKIENISSLARSRPHGRSPARGSSGKRFKRILERIAELHHSLWPVLVLLTSIAVDFWRSRELRAVAEQTGSPALATDAFHFASDIWATLAVLVGLGRQLAGHALRLALAALCRPGRRHRGFAHDSAHHLAASRAKPSAC